MLPAITKLEGYRCSCKSSLGFNLIDFKIIDIENEENRLFTLSESDTEIDSCEEESIQSDDWRNYK